MSNIRRAFEKGKAFIPFITCGDPSLAVTEELACAMAEAGADLIELGIPFSDPTAEGPVIQAANVRALRGGATTDKILETARRIRARVDTPLAFMTYAKRRLLLRNRALRRSRGLGGRRRPHTARRAV